MVSAPPGTGKTTRIPPALLEAGLLGRGACVVLEPRRVAARAAARRVAAEQGWALGAEVGYRVRHERVGGQTTRIWFVTEGVLLARVQSDPGLDGVSVVILDEFHERSLEADLAIAFLREVREALRPDLRILVCSATLDTAPVARYLDAAVIEVAGRTHPVEVRYLERPDGDRLALRVARGVRQAWPLRPGGRGDVLAFLPGAREIREAARALEPWARERGVALAPLHGDLPPRRQDEALSASTTPRVFLSTNVAETSVTLPGVTAVVDGGFARVLRHDPASGIDRLETVPVSRASAEQRAGRAGRLGPGLALRLWTPHDDRSRPAHGEPEIRRVDLSRPVLEVLAWGHPDPATFRWYEPPDPARLASALELLRDLGAVDREGRLTSRGEALRRLPLHPRLGTLALEAAARGRAAEGALLAALASEREVLLAGRAFGPAGEAPTGPSDLLWRMDLVEEAAREGFSPAATRRLGLDPGAARAVWRAAAQIRSALGAGPGSGPGDADDLLAAVLAGFPDRVARRRGPGSGRFVLAGGRGAALDPRSAVRRDGWVVAVRLDAGRRGERSEALIRWASRIDPGWLRALPGWGDEVRTALDPAAGRVSARRVRTYRGLVVEEQPVRPDSGEAAALLAREAARDPLRILAAPPEVARLVARCRFLARVRPDLGLPGWEPPEWEELLRGLALGAVSLEELRRRDLLGALRARLTREQLRALDREAPDRIRVPSGSRIRVEYPEGADPVLAVKIQEVFGWREGPRVAGGGVAVVLHLLGPHGRPLQVTRDLASFWDNTYPEVRREMRGRYPRHRWPEDPWRAEPSRRTTKGRR